MKRRLDLALALVHGPRILFLDEPTTGLDPQSRAALWEEVARLAHDEGMTVFLTTQYLEEADVLADRVGIIDHGTIVAEGTPAQLKEEIGSPSVEVSSADEGAGERLTELLAGFGAPTRVGRDSVTVAAARRGGPAGRDRPRARSRRSARVLAAVAPAVAGRRVPGQDRAASWRARPTPSPRRTPSPLRAVVVAVAAEAVAAAPEGRRPGPAGAGRGGRHGGRSRGRCASAGCSSSRCCSR